MLILPHRLSLIVAISNVDRSKKRARAAITKKVNKFLDEAELAAKAYGETVTPAVMLAHSAAVKAHPELEPDLPWREPTDDVKCEIVVPSTPRRAQLVDDHHEALLQATEKSLILLPSSYHSAVRRHSTLHDAVAIERQLREGQANDALDNLRLNIAARHSLRNLRQAGQGQKHGKVVRALGLTEQKIGDEAKDEYRRVRIIMRVLGMPEDHETYQPLRDEDMKHFVVVDEQHKLNTSSKKES